MESVSSEISLLQQFSLSLDHPTMISITGLYAD